MLADQTILALTSLQRNTRRRFSPVTTTLRELFKRDESGLFTSDECGRNTEKEELEDGGGGGGVGAGRGEEEKISKEKYVEHARGKNIPGVGVFLCTVCRSSRSGASSNEKGWVKRGAARDGEGSERGRERRSSPVPARSLASQLAQQKRDKSSTLIRILPLFALWNTILNGMGAQ